MTTWRPCREHDDRGHRAGACAGGRGCRLRTGAGRQRARHDRDGSWVDDSFAHLRDAGLLAIAVPVELGGAARTCGRWPWCSASWPSTAPRPRWPAPCTSTSRRSPRGATGAGCRAPRRPCAGWPARASCWCPPAAPTGPTRSGTATKVEGGYVVSGRKSFASQSPAGTVMSTMFTYDDPERGLRVLNMAVPMADEHVRVLTTGTRWACGAPPATTWSWTGPSSPTSACSPTGPTASSTLRCR